MVLKRADRVEAGAQEFAELESRNCGMPLDAAALGLERTHLELGGKAMRVAARRLQALGLRQGSLHPRAQGLQRRAAGDGEALECEPVNHCNHRGQDCEH
jgi:hypothetical protein